MKTRHLLVCLTLALPAIPMCIISATAQEATSVAAVSEPEMLNVVMAIDTAGGLVSLERVTAKAKASAKLTGGAKVVAQLPEARATVRLTMREGLCFVVKLANGVDPATIKLYAFESKKNKREVLLTDASYFSTKSGLGMVPVDVKKHGESSYKLVPTKPLPAGEFGFSSETSNDVFAFGIDAAK